MIKTYKTTTNREIRNAGYVSINVLQYNNLIKCIDYGRKMMSSKSYPNARYGGAVSCRLDLIFI
jgi:hypothetical protein